MKSLVSIVLPVTAAIVSSFFAFYGNSERQAIETDIQRKFALVRTFNEVLTLTVNAETSVRGYQLTERGEFLQPYRLARQELPAKLDEWESLVNAEPGEKPRLEKLEIFKQVKSLIETQMNDLEWQQNRFRRVGEFDEELYRHIVAGKNNMDTIRRLLGQTETAESERLGERIEQINDIRRRDYIIVFIVLAVALLTRFVSWHLLNKGVHERIAGILKRIEERRSPDAPPVQSVGEMEVLEEEVNRLIEKEHAENQISR